MSPSSLLLDAWQTSLEAAKANTLASSTAMVAHLNNELKKRYDSQHDSWKIMVEAGKIDNLNPPKPPSGYELQPNDAGFVFYGLGQRPVCDPRKDIPADQSKQRPGEVGQLDVINVPSGDTQVVGAKVSGIDLLILGADPREIGTPASRWEKKEKGGPWGVWKWYQRIA